MMEYFIQLLGTHEVYLCVKAEDGGFTDLGLPAFVRAVAFLAVYKEIKNYLARKAILKKKSTFSDEKIRKIYEEASKKNIQKKLDAFMASI